MPNLLRRERLAEERKKSLKDEFGRCYRDRLSVDLSTEGDPMIGWYVDHIAADGRPTMARYSDIPIPITCKSGGFEKKAQKNLEIRTSNLQKYASNKNNNDRLFVSENSLPY